MTASPAPSDDPSATLSMKLQEGNYPFALTPEERLFGPDDWAWQFLRLNPHYIRDYAKAKELRLLRNKQDRLLCESAIGFDSPYRNRPDITYRSIIESEKECRRQYGLSTWLNHNYKHLPPFEPDDGDKCSWFFPLRTVRHSNLTLIKAVVEGIFAYCEYPDRSAKPERPPWADWGEAPEWETSVPAVPKKSSVITFMVRIDRPLSSQLAAIEVLTKYHENILKKTPKQIVRPNNDLHEFLSCRPIKLSQRAPEQQASHIVRIEIDTWASLPKQFQHYRAALSSFVREHKNDVGLSGLVDFPVRSEKQYRISREAPTVILSDGNPYKRMIVVRQLADADLGLAEIVDFVRAHGKTIAPQRDPAREYYFDFRARIEAALEEAEKFINSAYRWFVYADKSPVNSETPRP